MSATRTTVSVHAKGGDHDDDQTSAAPPTGDAEFHARLDQLVSDFQSDTYATTGHLSDEKALSALYATAYALYCDAKHPVTGSLAKRQLVQHVLQTHAVFPVDPERCNIVTRARCALVFASMAAHDVASVDKLLWALLWLESCKAEMPLTHAHVVMRYPAVVDPARALRASHVAGGCLEDGDVIKMLSVMATVTATADKLQDDKPASRDGLVHAPSTGWLTNYQYRLQDALAQAPSHAALASYTQLLRAGTKSALCSELLRSLIVDVVGDSV